MIKKQNFCSVFLILIFLCPLWTQTSQPSAFFSDFTIGLKTGVISGNDYELLYYSPASAGILESMLDWEVNAPVFQLSAETLIKNHWYIKLNPSAAIPGKSGNMQDYDWLNEDVYFETGSHELSKYSCHTNRLNYYFDLSLDAGYTFFTKGIYSVTPYLNGDFNTIYFSAYDGYRQYPNKTDGKYIWTEDTEKIYMSGLVISYQQYIYSIGAGLKNSFALDERLSFDLGFQFNVILFYNSYDWHTYSFEKTGAVFGDAFYFKPAFDFSFETAFKINSHWKADFCLQEKIIPAAWGTTYSRNCTQWKDWVNQYWSQTDDSNGGAERYLCVISTGFSYSF